MFLTDTLIPKFTQFCRPGVPVLFAALAATLFAPPALAQEKPLPFPLKNAQPDTLTDEQVVLAMTKAIDYLFEEQKKGKGTWELGKIETPFHKWPEYEGGVTALTTYALLHAGKSLPSDRRLSAGSPELKPALEYVKNLRSTYNYIKSYQLVTLAHLPTSDANKLALRTASSGVFSNVPPSGGYGYRYNSGPLPLEKLDASNSQIGLLAAWELDSVGIEIPIRYWSLQNTYWRKTQFPDGSWGYRAESVEGSHRKSAHTMTCAALASLYILQDQTSNAVDLTMKPDKNLETGMAWLDKNFDKDTIFSGGDNAYYFLYTLERSGLAAGRKYIGNIDWYRAGAAKLLQRQRPDGSWEGVDSWFDCQSPHISTALSLIFLSRGRNPVAFNKLEYPGNTWNARSRDLANLTTRMSKDFERPVNWQVVNLKSNPEDWLDAPVLLITGSADPKFTDEDLAKLRTFIEAGGILFSTADGAKPEFTKALTDALIKLTGNQFEPRELPNDHPIFNAWSKTKKPTRMLGMSNGIRELWIHSNTDMGAAWQRRATASAEAFEIPANLFFYAAGGTEAMQPRLRSLRVLDNKAEPKRKLTLARVEYNGNWNPEPGAWPRFAKLLRANSVANLTLSTVKIADLDPKKIPVAHLTGSTAISLNEADSATLKAYLANGGTLLVDNAGGKDAFDASIRKILESAADAPLAPLAPDDPILAGTIEGTLPAASVTYRREATLKRGRSETPDLLAIKKGDRYLVIYTPTDITSGLLGTNTQGILGYSPTSAQLLARNILIASQSPPPQKPPAKAAAK